MSGFLRRVVMNSKNEMMIERAWPCGNKFLMDSEQHTILLSSLQRAFVETVCCICRVMLKSKVEVKLSRWCAVAQDCGCL